MKEANERYTNLFTHLRVDLLRAVFHRLKKQAAAGVDGVTWHEYEKDLDARLAELQGRLHRMAYKPAAVRRTYIPKADGKQRPLGIPTIEDKVVQGAVVAILTPIYEAEFLDCSFAFRPGQNQHMALDEVQRIIQRGKVSWVLDLDIRAYFDSIDHEWLVRMVEHRIGDRRLIRLIRRWLKAGILEDGELKATTEGTPQGGLISPLLSNIYLHYVLDSWFAWARRRFFAGEAHMVRYADDAVVCFQRWEDARQFRQELEVRLARFGLQLHPDKTRLLRFGRFAATDCHKDGDRKPGTFDFLGFTHICGKSRKGNFKLVRRTAKKKRKGKMADLKQEMRRRMHWSVRDQWQWLCGVLRGHYQYYGISGNYRALYYFRERIIWLWRRSLNRRSQKAKMTWKRYESLLSRFPLPKARLVYRQTRLDFAPST